MHICFGYEYAIDILHLLHGLIGKYSLLSFSNFISIAEVDFLLWWCLKDNIDLSLLRVFSMFCFNLVYFRYCAKIKSLNLYLKMV